MLFMQQNANGNTFSNYTVFWKAGVDQFSPDYVSKNKEN